MRALAFLLLLSSPLYANTSELDLRGSGNVYWKKIIKLYKAELFAPSNATTDNILAADISKCLMLTYNARIKGDQIKTASEVIIKRQHSKESLSPVWKELQQLNDSWVDVNKNDQYSLCYDGQQQTLTLKLNSVLQFQSQSPDLARIYLGIWLSNNQPLSQKLRISLWD